jgi:hypothetical protein
VFVGPGSVFIGEKIGLVALGFDVGELVVNRGVLVPVPVPVAVVEIGVAPGLVTVAVGAVSPALRH